MFILIAGLSLSLLFFGVSEATFSSKVASLAVDQLTSTYSTSAGNFSLENLRYLMKALDVSPGGTTDSKIFVMPPIGSNTSEVIYNWICSNSSASNSPDVHQCFSKQCLSAEQLFLLAGVSLNGSLSVQALQQLSPILVAHATNTRCSLDSEEEHPQRATKRPSRSEIWGYGILSVTVISLGSLIGALLLPVSKTSCYKHLLSTMVALAVGALSGTAVYFLIPDGFGLSASPDFSDYVHKSTVLLAGIYLFFMTERSIKLILRAKSLNRQPKQEYVAEDDWHEQAERLGNNDTESCAARAPRSESSAQFLPLEANGSSESQLSPATGNGRSASAPNGVARSVSESSGGAHGHAHTLGEVDVVAWMVIFGDGLHNFVDGLAIGSAFSQDVFTGVSVSVAILCEELPHELGDFAVLLRAGMSVRRALLFNFLSACFCYAGLIVGILLGELGEANSWILIMAGGMFLYISLTDLLPEMNAELNNAQQDRGWPAIRLLLLQNLGLFLGWISIMLMALYGHNISF